MHCVTDFISQRIMVSVYWGKSYCLTPCCPLRSGDCADWVDISLKQGAVQWPHFLNASLVNPWYDDNGTDRSVPLSNNLTSSRWPHAFFFFHKKWKMATCLELLYPEIWSWLYSYIFIHSLKLFYRLKDKLCKTSAFMLFAPSPVLNEPTTDCLQVFCLHSSP